MAGEKSCEYSLSDCFNDCKLSCVQLIQMSSQVLGNQRMNMDEDDPVSSVKKTTAPKGLSISADSVQLYHCLFEIMASEGHNMGDHQGGKRSNASWQWSFIVRAS